MSVLNKTSSLAALLAIASVAITAKAATYNVTDLSVRFPNAFGEFSLNNVGHIMGHAVDPQLPAPNKYTFIYANGAIHRLASPPQSYAESLGFNDNGDMTGNLYRYAENGAQILQGVFLYKNGQLTDITSELPKAQAATRIQTINNAGVLLGNYSYHAASVYLYDSNTGQEITFLSTYGAARASALNNGRQVTGQNFFSGLNHAYLYSGSGYGVTELFSFAPARTPNDYSDGLGINDAGHVVGYAGTTSGYSHAFLYKNSVMTDLGTLSGFSSRANDINNAGVIVGTSQVSPTAGDEHAFIYEANAMTDLNSLIDPNDPLAASITLVSATTINDRGEILVKGKYASGQSTTFLLTLKQSSTDNAYYHFEQTTHDWYNSGEDIVAVAASTAQTFAGTSSLAVQFNGAGFVAVGAMYPPLLAGKTVAFHIYIPAAASVEWVQPFALEDYAGNWAWHGNWQPIANLQLGAWNTITLDIPADATPFYRIGVEVYTSQPYTGTVYVDSVGF